MATLAIIDPTLTARQKQVHKFIVRHIEIHQRPPTQTEIARALRSKGRTGVLKHLKKLDEAGLIKLQPGKSRGISILIDSGSTEVRAPILGAVASRAALTKARGMADDWITVSSNVFPLRPDYFLRLKWPGLALRGGDLAAIKAQDRAESGQVVLLDGEPRPLIKTLKHDGFHWWLVSEDGDPERTDPAKLRILGIMVGLIRSMPIQEEEPESWGRVVLGVPPLRKPSKKS